MNRSHTLAGHLLLSALAFICAAVFTVAGAGTAQAAPKFINPRVHPYKFIFYKGQSRYLKVRGYAAGETPVYKISSGSKYFKVNSQGKVTAKTYGTSKLTTTVGSVKKTVYVYCAKPQAYRATRQALKMKNQKLRYSQLKRMSSRYVDCSSFVWRAYRPQKFYFGSPWGAPTAANEAKWCVRHGRRLNRAKFKKNVGLFKPGDVIFYTDGTKNGRYKNISHVEMYLGNDVLIHAAHKGIGYDYKAIVNSVVLTRPVR
ncbi:MAG: NlpC/P60 family protein [Anaerovoracaceae bacterium]|jgi:cell wall-associated NlpC family hydrolase